VADPDLRHCYDIVVRGRLSRRYDCVFDGVTLEPLHGETSLHTELADQAELYGLLHRLRDFGIELVRVNAVPRAGNAG
jgi:hypothetical protein